MKTKKEILERIDLNKQDIKEIEYVKKLATYYSTYGNPKLQETLAQQLGIVDDEKEIKENLFIIEPDKEFKDEFIKIMEKMLSDLNNSIKDLEDPTETKKKRR